MATYRLQLGPEFTFAELGQVIRTSRRSDSDCHLSPFLQPTSDRSHGYDVADYGQLNSALGTEAEYRGLIEALASHSMGQLMDLVPNHMGIAGSRNAWWTDVLENGRAAACAGFFDIEWDPIKPELKDKVLLPLLGDQFGRLLENQELQLEYGPALSAFATTTRSSHSTLHLRGHSGMASRHAAADAWGGASAAAGTAQHRHGTQSSAATDGAGPARLEERQREKEVVSAGWRR